MYCVDKWGNCVTIRQEPSQFEWFEKTVYFMLERTLFHIFACTKNQSRTVCLDVVLKPFNIPKIIFLVDQSYGLHNYGLSLYEMLVLQEV